MIPLYAIDLNTSVLNNYKSSGKFNLLDQRLTELLTVYETTFANYYKAGELYDNIFNKELHELMLYFLTLDKFENIFHPNYPINKHPDYIKSDSEFVSYVKSKAVFEVLHRISTQTSAKIAWMEALERNVINILNEIEKQNND